VQCAARITRLLHGVVSSLARLFETAARLARHIDELTRILTRLSNATPALTQFRPSASGTVITQDIDALPLGRQPHVRTVASESELRALYDAWSRGGVDITPSGYNGTMVRLSDDTIVGWRNSSRSGGATIDVKYPDGTVKKVHVNAP
jgi:hypothetical protein